jgi:hypothetical protein
MITSMRSGPVFPLASDDAPVGPAGPVGPETREIPMTTQDVVPSPGEGSAGPSGRPGPGPVEDGPNPNRIFGVASGYMLASMLFVASEIDLFRALEPDGATAEEIGERCGVPARTARVVADVLAVSGLVLTRGDHYVNGQDTAAFLTGPELTGVEQTLRYWGRVSDPRAVHALQAVRTGRGIPWTMDEESTVAYEHAVAASTRAIGSSLAGEYDFGGHRTVLDVGGGIGALLVPVLQEHPHLSGVLLDLPEVAPLATEELDRAGLGERCRVVGADVFTDPLPDGADAIVVAHLLHLFGPADCKRILGRLRAAATDDIRLLMVDWWRDWTVPPIMPAVAAAEFLMIAGGCTYPSAEVSTWLDATGWRLLEKRRLIDDTSLLVAVPV